MESSQVRISQSRSGSGTRQTTTLGELEPSVFLQDSHLLDSQSEDNLGNTQPDKKSKLPWWKRPSPWWWAHCIVWKSPLFHKVHARLLVVTPFTALAGSSTITPRIEMYTTLACSILRPEYWPEYGESPQQLADILGSPHSNDCRIPAVPVAHQYHQSSCVNISDMFVIDKSLQTYDTDTPPTRKQRCASDPVVQAAVAKLTTRAYRFLCYGASRCTCSLSPGIVFLKNFLYLHYVGWWDFL